MDSIPETEEWTESSKESSKESSNELLDDYIRRIKDFLILDETMLREIRTFTQEEKMEIIVAMNEVILCFLSLLD